MRIKSTKTSQVAKTWYSIDKRQLLARCHNTGQKNTGGGGALYETAGESGGGGAWTKLAAVEMTRNQCHHSGHKEQSREKTVKVTTGGLKLGVPVTAAPMWGAWEADLDPGRRHLGGKVMHLLRDALGRMG